MLAAAPGSGRMGDLVDLLSRLGGGTVLSSALCLSRGARLGHVRANVDGVWTVQTRLRPSVDVQGGRCIAAGVRRKRHRDRVEARGWRRSVTFAPNLVKAKVLRRLRLASGLHGSECAEAGGCVCRHRRRLGLVELREGRRHAQRPIAHTGRDSPAAIHPYYISLHCTMGILRHAEVELGHVIVKICQTLAAFTIQETRTHFGQVLATCS